VAGSVGWAGSGLPVFFFFFFSLLSFIFISHKNIKKYIFKYF
jgi:hypothetical protein